MTLFIVKKITIYHCSRAAWIRRATKLTQRYHENLNAIKNIKIQFASNYANFQSIFLSSSVNAYKSTSISRGLYRSCVEMRRKVF